jgi:hypothetical protein
MFIWDFFRRAPSFELNVSVDEGAGAKGLSAAPAQ